MKLTRTDAVFSRATSVVFFCAGFWIFRYAGKIPKIYIKNQRSGSFHQAKGGPQGSQGAARRVPGAAQLLAAPPALLGGSHTPWCPTLAPIYSPVAKILIPDPFSPEAIPISAAIADKLRGTRIPVPAPCRDWEVPSDSCPSTLLPPSMKRE